MRYTPKVVLFSQLNDAHSARLCLELNKLGAEHLRIDAEHIADLHIEFKQGQYFLGYCGSFLSISEPSSVFVRRKPSSKDFGTSNLGLSANSNDYIKLQKEVLFQDMFFAFQREVRFYNEFQPATAMMGKGIQQRLAKKLGLLVPETQIGGTNHDVSQFIEQCWSSGKEVCTKPLSPAYLEVDGETFTRFTEIVPRNVRLDEEDFESCPLIIQEYIEKAYELRVTVCDDKAIAIRIESQKASGGTQVDWRKYNIPETPHFEHTLDDEIKKNLINFNKAAGLRFSCFDLIVTPRGQHYFIETNQSGQWLWLEEITGAKITEMIARQLVQAS